MPDIGLFRPRVRRTLVAAFVLLFVVTGLLVFRQSWLQGRRSSDTLTAQSAGTPMPTPTPLDPSPTPSPSSTPATPQGTTSSSGSVSNSNTTNTNVTIDNQNVQTTNGNSSSHSSNYDSQSVNGVTTTTQCTDGVCTTNTN